TGFLQQNFPEANPKKFCLSDVMQIITHCQMDRWDRVAFPEWLFKKFQENFGSHADRIMESLNQQAPVCLRANTLKTDRENLAQLLKSEDILTVPASDVPDGLVLKDRK